MSDPNTDKHPGRIPEFASLEEEAAFWDAHDTTDVEDEFHPVTVVFEGRLATERTGRVGASPITGEWYAVRSHKSAGTP